MNKSGSQLQKIKNKIYTNGVFGGIVGGMKKGKYEKLVSTIKTFCDDRDWSQFHDPKNLAISLNLEASEVLELFQWTLDNKVKPDKEEGLSGELADVFYWLIMLSNHYNIDLVQALEEKMKINAKKYPVNKAKGVSTKYTEL